MECPHCKVDLNIFGTANRWNGKTICPSCSGKIMVDYDFTYNEVDNEEYDYYELRIPNEGEYKNKDFYVDFFETELE